MGRARSLIRPRLSETLNRSTAGDLRWAASPGNWPPTSQGAGLTTRRHRPVARGTSRGVRHVRGRLVGVILFADRWLCNPEVQTANRGIPAFYPMPCGKRGDSDTPSNCTRWRKAVLL